jgi:membrane-associated phospholipid phosphatase
MLKLLLAIGMISPMAVSQANLPPQAPATSDGTALDSPQRLERNFFLNFAKDQGEIWTSPFRLKRKDLGWLIPAGAATAAMIATDKDSSKEFTRGIDSRAASRFTDVGLISTAGISGGIYLWGRFQNNSHARETGILAAQAAANAFAVNSAIKFATGRERPDEGNGHGDFFQSGQSFPSNHAMLAWSMASVIAHEYPGRLTKFGVYGLASAVTAGRVASGKHFVSDAVVGSALGWAIGRYVYRAHHNAEFGGANIGENMGTFVSGDGDVQHPRRLASPNAPLDSWVYPAFDRLAALGFAPSAFLGMRPWSRLECARILVEADELLESADESRPGRSEAYRIHKSLLTEFHGDVQTISGDSGTELKVDSVYARAVGISGPPMTDGYHFSQTILNDTGRRFQEGFNSQAGFSLRGSHGRFAFFVRAEYQHAPGAPPLSPSTAAAIAAADFHPPVPPMAIPQLDRMRLMEGYVTANLRGWHLSVGKQSLWYGPARGGSLNFGKDAEPMPLLRLSRPEPVKMPKALSWLGPTRFEFMVGQLAGHDFINTQTPPIDPQPFFHAQKLSFKPTRNFEFSVSRTTIFAGKGIPLTAETFFRSVFSLENRFGSSDPGDRRSGFDFSYRIPKLRDWVVFYSDSMAEDEFSPIAYPHRSAFTPGLYFPQLPKIPKMDLRIEGGFTDLPNGLLFPGFYYFNVRYQDGYTYNGNLLGHWIGRQGYGYQAWATYWFSPEKTLQFAYRRHQVSRDFLQGGGNLSDFQVSSRMKIGSSFALNTMLQVERYRFLAISPRVQQNVATQLELVYRPMLNLKKFRIF